MAVHVSAERNRKTTMRTRARSEKTAGDGLYQPAASGIAGGTPPTLQSVAAAIGHGLWRMMGQPRAAVVPTAHLARELALIAVGRSTVAPDPADRRFADPAWSEHPGYGRLMQSYLAWRAALNETVDRSGLDRVNADRARFALTFVTETLAPTNTLLGNPAAVKRAFETGGMSLVRGFRNFLNDVRYNRGLPSQSTRGDFEVGRTLATTPGAVIHRNEVCEIIQYRPSTEKTFSRPLLVIPPQISKFYFLDLSKGRSLVEYALAGGLPLYLISWRNPTAEQRAWNLDTYVKAVEDAAEVACEVAGSPDLNVLGLCAGGITTLAALSHLAATGSHKVHSATLAVTMIDTKVPSMAGMFDAKPLLKLAAFRSRAKGFISGRDMGSMFTWMRPNDLVWNYWVNNYLLGNKPPVFDLLYWNSDSTRLPAGLHCDFLEIMQKNSLAEPNGMKVRGTELDLGPIDCDLYVLAASDDHLVAWQSAYRLTQLASGSVEFVLSNSGHIQGLVNPPSNTKAQFFSNPNLDPNPAVWLDNATLNSGSWWPHWLKWVASRSGAENAAPTELGSPAHRPSDPAPGRYVYQR
jgi:poly[(R)-3-hydroxyalkanoate] polymerase subunit PhaC